MSDEKGGVEDWKKMLGIPTGGKSSFSLAGVGSASSTPKQESKSQSKLSPSDKTNSSSVDDGAMVGPKRPTEEEEEEKSSPPEAPSMEDFSPVAYRLGWSRDEADDEEERMKLLSYEEPKSIEEKRNLYSCGEKYTTLDTILNWQDYYKTNNIPFANSKNLRYTPDDALSKKISIFHGDITSLEIDAIVNAANRSLLGGGGIDGAIHDAAGDYLQYECRTLNGCPTGHSKITRGYNLPSKYVIHTVGPVSEDSKLLRSCYKSTLEICKKRGIKSVAFCCVATGIFGFDLKKATMIALDEVRRFLTVKENFEMIDRIVFCCYLRIEKSMYEYFIPWFFPMENQTGEKEQSKKIPKKKKWWESSSEEED